MSRSPESPQPSRSEMSYLPLEIELTAVRVFFETLDASFVPRIDHFRLLLYGRGPVRSFFPLFTAENQAPITQLRLFEVSAEKVSGYEAAEALCLFLARLNDPVCRAWIMNDRVAWPSRAELTELSGVCSELGFEAFSKSVSFATVCRFVDLITKAKKGSNEKSGCRVGLVAFIRSYPDKLEHMIQIYERYRRWDVMSWKETLRALYDLMELMGDDSLITDDDLNQALFHLWQPEAEAEISHKQSFHSLPESKRQQTFSRLRNSLSGNDTRAVRRFLTEQLPAEECKARRHQRVETLEKVALVENVFHPWHSISATLGTEIEAELPRGGVSLRPLLLSLSSINHHMGEGGRDAPLELSPGPFRTGLTMNAIHQAWIDSGWLDLHSQRLQTLHQSVGLLDEQTLINLNGMIISCAEVYRPVKVLDLAAFFYLHMLYNRAETGMSYLETKGFSVINARDLKSHNNRYALLATAARCYEKVHGASSIKLLEHMMPVSVPPSREISEYVSRLESIWVATVDRMDIAYQFFGVKYHESFEKPSLIQIHQILRVFPTLDSHLDAKNRVPEVVEPGKLGYIKRYGRDAALPYQNIVEAARAITDQACIEIEAVMMEMQEDFVGFLLQLDNPRTGNKNWLLSEFNTRFPGYRERVGLKHLISKIGPAFQPFVAPGNTLPRPVSD